MMILDDEQHGGACIKVIGVGGAGGNAVNTMIEAGIEGVQFIVANTDRQALANNLADIKIQIGESRTQGLGAGSNPKVGQEAATESASLILEQLKGAHMVFVTAGMGGGTGTGAAPVIAGIAKELGALTVGVVTKPFKFEGKRRRRQAEEGLEQLKLSVDTLITIPNERLLQTVGEQMTLFDSFRQADGVLLNAVRSISELIVKTGYVNVDFADVRTVMSNKGLALMGTGVGEGPNRATEAAEAAISSPLLDDISLEGATSVLLNITAPKSATLIEISEAATLIEDAASEEVHMIWGHTLSEDDSEQVKVTIIATGFDRADARNEDGPHSMQAPLHGGFGQFNQGQHASGNYAGLGNVSQPNPSTSRGGYVAAQAGAKYAADAGVSGNFPSPDIAQKMQELDARSDSIYAPSATPRQNSYAPNRQTSGRPQDAFAQAQAPIAIDKAPLLRDSGANARPVAESGHLEAYFDDESLDTPAFLRRSNSKKYFMD